MAKNKKNISLDPQQVDEIQKLKTLLQEHKKEYAEIKTFCKNCDDALVVADSLLNNDYATFKKFSLKFTKHTAEKMSGMQSLSTYKKTSFICLHLQQYDCICKKCYAEKCLSLYKASLIPALIYNTLLLKYIDIDPQQIPYTNNKYFRFESFSDLQSSKHFKNLIAVCKKNKNTLFTLWTKAGYLLHKFIQKENILKLPNNLNIVCSEIFINKRYLDDEYLNGLQSVLNTKNKLKAFCVYDDKTKQQASNLFICKNKCIDCLKCYKKSTKNIYIAEKLH